MRRTIKDRRSSSSWSKLQQRLSDLNLHLDKLAASERETCALDEETAVFNT